MLTSEPSLIQIVSDGGILMGPFLLVALAWIICTLRYILNRTRRLKALVGLLLFPLAFGLLAISHWFLHTHAQFKEMVLSGYPSDMEHILNGLVVTRSGLVIVATGGISLIVSGLLFTLRSKQEQEDEQAASSNH